MIENIFLVQFRRSYSPVEVLKRSVKKCKLHFLPERPYELNLEITGCIKLLHKQLVQKTVDSTFNDACNIMISLIFYRNYAAYTCSLFLSLKNYYKKTISDSRELIGFEFRRDWSR